MSYHQTHTAITSLPPEITSKIFLHCVEPDFDGLGLTRKHTIRTPLLLTSICKAWRDIAIGTQSLWARIYLYINARSTRSEDLQTSLVSTWLTRSGARPLRFFVFWETPPFHNTHGALTALIQHSERWQAVLLYLPQRVYASFEGIPLNLPLLTELSIGMLNEAIPYSRVPWGHSGQIAIFANAENLRSLEVSGIHPDMFRLPWNILRHIPMMELSVKDCLDILNRTPKLEGATFLFDGVPLLVTPDWPYRRPVLTHHNLRELAIETSLRNPMINFFNLFRLLSAPNLETLRFYGVHYPWSLQEGSLDKFLGKLPRLRFLYIRNGSFRVAVIVEILKLLPTLYHLSLESSPQSILRLATTDSLFKHMRFTNQSNQAADQCTGILVPQLKSLAVSVHSADAMQSLIGMLESRLNASQVSMTDESCHVSQLCCVNITTHLKLEETVINRLEALVTGKMRIVLGELASN